MAITYGKSNFPPGGIDTSDATVVASDMKVGVTAYGAAGTKITGTMTVHSVDQTASSITNSTTTLKFLAPAGYYDGSKYVTFTDADFAAGNIKSGVNIFGIDGTFTNDATATAGQILATVTAYVNGAKITGTMTNQGAYNITPSASNQSIPAGYHNGSGVVYGDSDLVAGNIKSGVNIFNVTGNYSPGGNWGLPALVANSFSAISMKNVNYSGNGIAYGYIGNKYVIVFFGSSIVTNYYGGVTSLDGITQTTSGDTFMLYGMSTNQTIYNFFAGDLTGSSLSNVNYSGNGIAYVQNNDFSSAREIIFFGSSIVTNSSGKVISLDGISTPGNIYLSGYSKKV